VPLVRIWRYNFVLAASFIGLPGWCRALRLLMKAFFRFLYELIGNPQPPADTPVYRDVVFPNIG
jgi:hypothetical protein